jgi:hypothetical protein
MKISDLRSDLPREGERAKPLTIVPIKSEGENVRIDWSGARDFETVARAIVWIKTNGGWFSTRWALVDRVDKERANVTSKNSGE